MSPKAALCVSMWTPYLELILMTYPVFTSKLNANKTSQIHQIFSSVLKKKVMIVPVAVLTFEQEILKLCIALVQVRELLNLSAR